MYWEIYKKLESTGCGIVVELQKDIILEVLVSNIKKKKNGTKVFYICASWRS